MPVVEIKPDIYWIGVNDRTTDLFENMWPITREGVAYNAYLIKDQKKAIIDSAKSLKTNEFLNQIQEIADLSDIDYLIINHMEPDHSGALHSLKQMAPQITFVGTQKTREELAAFYSITDNVKVVNDGEMLPLGRREVRFVTTPMVHWPETMMTYVKETLRYFTNIMAKFSAMVLKAIDKVSDTPIKIVRQPGIHGPTFT